MRVPRMDLNFGGSRFSARPNGKRVVIAWLTAITLILPTIGLALSGPQKLVIDGPHNRYLVSNFYGTSLSAIDIDTEVETPFIPASGLLDGMAIIGNSVYGSANGRVILGYDLNTGLETLSVWFGGGPYLSSVEADSSGHLFISCPYNNEIYKLRVSDGTFWTFEGSGALQRPNGMIFQEDRNRLIVVEDKAYPSIHAIDLADSTVTTLATTTLIGADGIAEDVVGNYYVAGYYEHGVYKFDPTFSQPPEMIYEGDYLVYPTYEITTHSLLVTNWNDDTIVRIPLDPTDIPPLQTKQSFLLHQNYPNPFTGGTAIRFDLAASADARLDVFDVLGRRVNTLMAETRGQGGHSVMWNGDSASGEAVASGLYYFRLTVDGVQQTQRGILTK